jgi:hypothetical protein
MSHNKKITVLAFVAGLVLLMTGCYKDKTVILDVPEITRTVTFSQDIVPIFNSSCSISGCHNKGGQSPDLSADNAFNSLTIGNYIDKNVPENSLIYLKMTGKKGNPMPMSGINKDYNALILAWIKQGANNN